MRAALTLALVWSMATTAFATPPDEEISTLRQRHPAQAAVSGRCGSYLTTGQAGEDPLEAEQPQLLLQDEWDPALFRDLGSPEHGTDVSLSVRVPWRDDRSSGGAAYGAILGDGNAAIDTRLRSVIANHLGVARNCLLAEVAFAPAQTGLVGNAAVGLTFMSRQMHDRLRIQIGYDFAFPTIGGPNLTSPYVQSTLSRALVQLEDAFRLLPNLEWSMRGRLRFETRGDIDQTEDGISLWFALQGHIGGARMTTAASSVDGLLGGIFAELLVGNPRLHQGHVGVRGGARLMVNISSLWPTDILFPMNAEGSIQVAWSPGRCVGAELEIFGGGAGLNYLRGWEWWAQLGGRLTLQIEWAPARTWQVLSDVNE